MEYLGDNRYIERKGDNFCMYIEKVHIPLPQPKAELSEAEIAEVSLSRIQKATVQAIFSRFRNDRCKPTALGATIVEIAVKLKGMTYAELCDYFRHGIVPEALSEPEPEQLLLAIPAELANLAREAQSKALLKGTYYVQRCADIAEERRKLIALREQIQQQLERELQEAKEFALQAEIAGLSDSAISESLLGLNAEERALHDGRPLTNFIANIKVINERRARLKAEQQRRADFALQTKANKAKDGVTNAKSHDAEGLLARISEATG